MNRYMMTASNILLSEAQPNKKYMTVKMRMFSTQPNLNDVMVTEAFIDRIIANKEDYVCMPLCADVKKMQDGDKKGLHHLYDKKTGLFLAEMIGAFYDIQKVNDEYGVSLIGEARINKRNPKVCETIESLYKSGELNFSFEIIAENIKTEDGKTIVDADEGNDLYSMAVVSIPAYPEATALALTAETGAEGQTQEKEHTGAVAMYASDASLDSIQGWIQEMVYRTRWGEIFGGCDCVYPNILLVTDTYFLVYFHGMSETYKFEYVIAENRLIVKDLYRVTFVRVGGDENKMNEENKAMENAEVGQVASETKVASETEVVSETEIVSETETTEAEVPATEIAEEKEDDSDMEKTIEELRKQVEELTKYKDELEAIRKEQEKVAVCKKKSALSEYAVENKLDIEDPAIAEAIESLNFETLIFEVMKASRKAKEETQIRNFESEVFVDKYGGLLDRV